MLFLWQKVNSYRVLCNFIFCSSIRENNRCHPKYKIWSLRIYWRRLSVAGYFWSISDIYYNKYALSQLFSLWEKPFIKNPLYCWLDHFLHNFWKDIIIDTFFLLSPLVIMDISVHLSDTVCDFSPELIICKMAN